ncbi:phasin family protein [Microvirga arabica]|uniref:phasin family protein n=1 Tax=Microvirga arabica TaxID=1128671 RepID=UPI00193ADE25|nr:phasin family protein [Microvirga arabica]MBM1173851.1 phasin family protein [Microvirga arabica]
MSATRRFSQAPPDKVNELFEKLVATSSNAVKTRERLFADLKEELELLASLQEEHLLPILRRHGMEDLVREARNDNQETAALLGELERMPKNDPEFIGKLDDLRRAFQQHIRDDRKELLPAVLKVLSDDEANAIAETVEDEMANIDENKRADARRAREQVETTQRVTEDVANTLRAGIESAQTMAQAMQEAVTNSWGAFSELARRSAGQALPLAGQPDGTAQGLTEETAHNLRAVAQSSAALTRGLQDVSREVVERSQKRLQRNLDGLQALARCRSMTDFVEVQSSLLRDNLEQTVENSRRIAELTIQMTGEATRTVTAQVERTNQHLNRAA